MAGEGREEKTNKSSGNNEKLSYNKDIEKIVITLKFKLSFQKLRQVPSKIANFTCFLLLQTTLTSYDSY